MPFSTEGQPWTGLMSCPVCLKVYNEGPQRPISLSCGHSVCKTCAQGKLKEKRCPFDQIPFPKDADKLPANFALMDLVGATLPQQERDTTSRSSDNPRCYELARNHVEEMASYLKPLAENDSDDEGTSNSNPSSSKNYQGPSACVLSRPLQRKLISLIHCQLLEEEGCSRATRIARSLGERIVSELLIIHQYPHQLSANLWAAVRTRGCQFLGPAMQEEVLKLILFALEDGSFLSRKVLVLFVVQRLEKRYPQASKTAIGHVVQLLYRASCFKVCKRDEASSLMQLKEEFRQYEALRREHDSQIVQIAMEAGLRISPEQWSSLLYGDPIHKSHMQSIIDKHQSPQTFSQSITELLLTLQHCGNPGGLLQLKPQLQFLSHIDPSADAPAPNWEDLEAVMRSLATVVASFVDYLSSPEHISRPDTVSGANARYKTSMCRDFSARGTCPRGSTCTFAHSQEEMERYRSRSRRGGNRGCGEQLEKASSSLTQVERDQLKMVEQMSQLKLNAKEIEAGEEQASVGGDMMKEEAEVPANKSEVQKVCEKHMDAEVKDSPVPLSTQMPRTSLPAQMPYTPLKSQGPQTSLSAQMPQTPVSAQMPYTSLKLQVSQTALSAHIPQTPLSSQMPPTPLSTHVSQTSMSPPTLLSTPTPVACHSLVTRQAPPSMPSATSQVPPTQLTFSRQTQEAFEPNSQRPPSCVFPHMSARFPYPHHHPYSDPSLMRAPYPLNAIPGSLPDSNPSQQFPSFPDSQGVQPHQHQHHQLHHHHHHHHQGNGQKHTSSLLVPPSHIPPLTGYVQNRFNIPVPPTQLTRPVDLPPSVMCEVPGVLCVHGITDCVECHKSVHTVPPNMMDGPDGALQSLVFGQAYPMHFPHQEQTLEDLTWKKQQILTNLQQGPTFMNACSENAWETSGPAGLDGLQTVLGKNKQKRQAMPKLVSDMYVAARSMCSLEQLIAEDEHCLESSWSLGQDGHQSSQDDWPDNTMKVTIGVIKNDSYTLGDTMSMLNVNGYEFTGGPLYNSLGSAIQVSTKASESYADSEDSSFPNDDDDNFIPFEHTFVSKFGPISRMARAKTNNCAPVQVTADSSKRTTPVLAVTPIEHPLPTTTRVPSRFNCSSLKTEPVVKPTPTEAPSIWMQSLQPSYRNIACLKAGAAEAVSNNERLAYELQAVELEISLKTGKMPETVGKIIQDAVMGSTESGKAKQEGTRDARSLPEPPVCTGPTGCHESGIMEVMSHGHVTECLTSFQQGQSLVSSETAARQVMDDYNCSWQGLK